MFLKVGLDTRFDTKSAPVPLQVRKQAAQHRRLRLAPVSDSLHSTVAKPQCKVTRGQWNQSSYQCCKQQDFGTYGGVSGSVGIGMLILEEENSLG